jgi:hypothetical protein
MGDPHSARPFDRFDAGLILACAVFLYANLFANPETPFLLAGDQMFFWMDGLRLLHGERVYRDFFQFTAPGTDLLYLGVFKLFGPRIWVTNLVVLVLNGSLCVLCLHISRSIMPRAQAALATSLYLVLVLGMTLQGTHHLLSLVPTLGAVAVLMKGRTPAKIVIAGALLGVATFITQTRGPVAALGFAAWMMWERSRTKEPPSSYLRQQVLLFAPLILTWLILSSHYIATLGLRQILFFQVAYVCDYKVQGWTAGSTGFPDSFSRAMLLPLIGSFFAFVVLPIVYAICLWKCRRLSRESPDYDPRLGVLTAVGAALFLEITPSPSWFRFYCVALPGVILLVWLVGGLGKLRLHAMRLLWIGVIGFAAYLTWSKHAHQSTIAELPAGRVSTSPLSAEKLGWLAARTKPGQYMLQAEWPGMYLPLELRNPIYLDHVATEGASELGYLALSLRQLEAKPVQYIVQSPGYSVAAAFHDFLVRHYRLVWKFSDEDEIWERKPDGEP